MCSDAAVLGSAHVELFFQVPVEDGGILHAGALGLLGSRPFNNE